MNTNEKNMKLIVQYLINKPNFVSAHEISQAIGVSNKTIYRAIRDINKSSSQKIINSKRGEGYFLNYSEYIKYKNTLERDHSPSPDKRRNSITELLLFKAPNSISIITLCEKFFVSESVIDVDEKIIAKTLQTYNLKLIRENKRISVTGSEGDIRNTIIQLILGNKIAMDFYNKSEDIDQEIIAFAKKQVSFIEQSEHVSIPYPYNVNIASHLYIMIQRIMQGDINSYCASQKLSFSEKKVVEDNYDLYELAQQVISNIEFWFSIQIPDSEIYYLFQYLISSRIDPNYSDETHYSSLVYDVAKFYIDNVFQKLNYRITNNKGILKNLIKHIQPMINRINHNIMIKNHFLEDIKQEYGNILKAVSEVSNEVAKKYDFNTISNDESGFIALYFANFFESNQREVNAIIMCTTGIGTSELLKTKIKNAFPEIKIVDVISTEEFKKYNKEKKEIDLVITTTYIKSNSDIPEVLVTALFTENDQNRVKDAIRNIGI